MAAVEKEDEVEQFVDEICCRYISVWSANFPGVNLTNIILVDLMFKSVLHRFCVTSLSLSVKYFFQSYAQILIMCL